MRSTLAGILVLVSPLGALASDVFLSTRDFPVDVFAKVRCSLDGDNVFMEWRGSVYAQVPGERQKLLFKVVGMNVARCLAGTSGLELVSREIQLYLDPATGERLEQWKNPWTEELLPVVHVANDPVQNALPAGVYTADIANGQAVFGMDIPLTYPNRLSADARFAAYAPFPLYQAIELFRYAVPVSELEGEDLAARTVTFSWSRQGPWLPWMKMGDRPGHLLYSANGARVSRFEVLSPLLRSVVASRLPAYREAPRCWLARSNETSWSYFAKHFARYLAAESFPVSEPIVDEVCR